MKMKTQLTIFYVLTIFSLPNLVAQNAFFDAQFLVDSQKTILDKANQLEKLKLEESELTNKDMQLKVSEVLDVKRFLTNPFDTLLNFDAATLRQSLIEVDTFINFIKKKRAEPKDRGGLFDPEPKPVSYEKLTVGNNFSAAAAPASAGLGLPSASFLSPTAIIDGAALFLKKRIKEELVSAFFDRMGKRLGSNNTLGILFPNTLQLLRGVAAMNDQVIPNLNALTFSAFQTDMETLPDNIENAIVNTANADSVSQTPQFKYFILPFNIIKHTRRGSHPATTLADMRSRYFNDETELSRVIQMMVALNENLERTDANSLDNNSLWINSRQWATLKKDPRGREMFMGLLFQKNHNGIFKCLKDTFRRNTYVDIRQSMVTLSDNMDDYVAQLNNFDQTYQFIQTNRGGRDSLSLELGWALTQMIDRSHWLYFSLLADEKKVFVNGKAANVRESPREAAKRLYWHTCKPLAESTLKALGAVQRKNWAGVMLNSYQILRGLSDIKEWREGQQFFQNNYLKTFFFYGNFMTDVLTCGSSQEVASILDRYAAPVGSYSLKRRSEFSVSLNSFPGISMGWEQANGFALPNGVQKSSFVSGVMAPIGLSFNVGRLGRDTNQSISAFVSIIDIGSVLSYRWANDAARGLPDKIEWSQVISPGIHFAYGLPEFPIALTAGLQLTPNLRKVEQSGNELRNGDFWRVSFGITTDITIFNLFSNANKKMDEVIKRKPKKTKKPK